MLQMMPSTAKPPELPEALAARTPCIPKSNPISAITTNIPALATLPKPPSKIRKQSKVDTRYEITREIVPINPIKLHTKLVISTGASLFLRDIISGTFLACKRSQTAASVCQKKCRKASLRDDKFQLVT